LCNDLRYNDLFLGLYLLGLKLFMLALLAGSGRFGIVFRGDRADLRSSNWLLDLFSVFIEWCRVSILLFFLF